MKNVQTARVDWKRSYYAEADKSAALRIELEAQRKDAERYRKWRADYTAAVASRGDGSCVTEMLLALADAWTPEDVDAAIDAAPAVRAA